MAPIGSTGSSGALTDATTTTRSTPVIHLHTIRVLFRAPDTLQLWAIPHDMREDVGQQPGDLWRAARRRYDDMATGKFNRGCGPAGPYIPPDPVAGWILVDEDDPDMLAWLSALDDVPHGPYEWCKCKLADDTELNTTRRHDKLARIAHRPGDVVRVLLGYRGNNHFAPDGTEGLYVVKARMDGGKGSDYKLIRLHWSSLMPDLRASLALHDTPEGADYRRTLVDDVEWDVICHAGRMVRFYQEVKSPCAA